MHVTQTNWQIDKKMNIKKKEIYNTNTVVNAGPPDTEDLYYLLDMRYVGCHLKGLIVAS